MIRVSSWQTWVPRLMLVVVSLLMLQLGLGLVARSVFVRSTQEALGVAVNAEHSRVEAGGCRVILGNLRFSSATSTENCLATAEVCDLELESRALLHKQFVANHGYLDGLRVEATLPAANEICERSTALPTWFRDDADVTAAKWFSHVAERLHEDVTVRLESIKQTKAFLATWVGKCAEIDGHGQDLAQQATEIQKTVDSNEANPLRNVTFLAELPQKVAELQRKFSALRGQIESQANQLDQQRRTIVAARRHDEALLNKPLTFDPVSAEAITAYLLRSEATKPLGRISTILHWARTTWPNTPPRAGAGRRGEDIVFAGCTSQPNFLIRTLELQGTARIASQPVELRGILSSFSSAPQLHDQPMRLRLTATGSMPVEFQATIDRTNGAQRDTLLVDAGRVLLPELKLGQANQVAMTVAPSTASLSISVTAEGDKLTGEIQLVQHDVHIVSTTGAEFAEVPLTAALNESLGKINSLATRISLSGTIEEPKCTLWSNLGPAVAEAMQRAAERVGKERTRASLAEAARQEDEQLTTAERQVSDQQTHWNARLAALSKQLQTIATAERPKDRLSPSRVSRQLPPNSLVR